MSAATYDVVYTESRNRVTTLFRYILAIPHLIVSAAWGYFAQILAVVQWFIVLFTGKRNRSIWGLQNDYVGYNTRVGSYVALMYDSYPPFGTDVGATGVTYSLEFEESANRLTNALRLLWAIPAAFIAVFVSIGACFVVVVSWLAIVLSGKHPRGMFDFVLKALRFSVRLNTYAMLMTDTYPKFE